VRRILKNTMPVNISNRTASPITNNACGRPNGTSGPCKEKVASLNTVLSSIVVFVIIMVLQNALALLFGFYPNTFLFSPRCMFNSATLSGSVLVQANSTSEFPAKRILGNSARTNCAAMANVGQPHSA
jgi:hypothetical protein